MQSRTPFKANNIFAELKPDGSYTVFSYGHHFPLYHYDAPSQTWYKNKDRYSASTSRHASQTNPLFDGIKEANTLAMKMLAFG